MAIEEAQAGPEDIIICRDVHKWFGRFHALRGVTTTIKKQEVVVILGPSGLGKVHLHTDHQPAGGTPARGHHR